MDLLEQKMLPTMLTVFSLLFLTITTLTVPRIETSSDIFLYVKSLPITYWAGLISSILVCVWKEKRPKFVIINSIAIAYYLFAIPNIVYIFCGSRDAYGHISRALHLVKVKHLGAIGIESFPGAYISAAMFLLITEIKPLHMLKAYSLFFTIMTALTVYLIARTLTKNVDVSLLAILGLLWFGAHFGKHTYGYMLWNFFWLFLILYIRKTNLCTSIACLLTYIALTISHPMPSFLIPLITLLYSFVQYLSRSDRAISKHDHYPMLLLTTIIWCLWYIVSGFFVKPLVNLLKSILEVREPLSHLRYFAPYSSEYLKVVYLRAFSSLFAIASGATISVLILFRKSDNISTLLAVGTLFCVGVFISPFTSLTLANLNRATEHMLIFYTPLLSIFLKKRMFESGFIEKVFANAMFSVFIALILLMPITTFTSSMPYMHIPTISHEMASFLSINYMPRSDDKLNLPNIAIEYHSILHNNFPLYYKWRSAEGLGRLYFLRDESTFIKAIGEYNLIVISHTYFVLDNFRIYDPPFKMFLAHLIEALNSDSRFNMVYMNSPFCLIYLREKESVLLVESG